MSFGSDDYPRAIARLWDSDGNVIGTGFLVAPGYVLTCAHVVLQAIGIDEDNFSKYDEQPQEIVSLDFPVLATEKKIEAEVVAWEAYRLGYGDVAVLKLRSPEPKGVKPIPLVMVEQSEVKDEKHRVYGFGKGDLGGQSDAYRPKTMVSGGRFQLCKFGDANDEARNGVIGMIATAMVAQDGQQSKAHAISTQMLKSVLMKIDAFCLHDILVQSLDECRGQERDELKGTIDEVLRQCNPNGYGNNWKTQLIELLDLPPNGGWEAEGRSVQFVMQLVRMDEIPEVVYDRLKQWIEHRLLNFAALLERITRDMKGKKISLSNVCKNVMVIVDPVETADDQVRLSLWQVFDHETNDSYNALKLISEKVIVIDRLPQFIWQTMGDTFGNKKPIIHYFVARSSFCCDTAITPFGRRERGLGCDYPFVIRTNLNTCPTGRRYHANWTEKWENIQRVLNHPMGDVIRSINCSLSEEEILEEMMDLNAAILQECDDVGDLFELIAEDTALPVALWSREPLFQERLADMLDCEVHALRDRIRQERDQAHQSRSQDSLGNHLSLVWEDPKIVPPDMRFGS